MGSFWFYSGKPLSLALPADLPVYGVVSECTRKCGLMSSKALSCLVLITMVVLLLRMRKLRPERRKCLPALPRSPEGEEPSGTQPLPPVWSLAFSTETCDTRAAWSLGYRKGSLGLQPEWLGLAGPGQQRRGKWPTPLCPELNPRCQPGSQREYLPAAQHLRGRVSLFNPHNNSEW